MRIRDGTFREPDPLLVRDDDDRRCRDDYWLGANLVMEVVSPEDPDRELVEKRFDYAEAGTPEPEYWIVNSLDEAVTVLVLAGDDYREHGERYLRASRRKSSSSRHANAARTSTASDTSSTSDNQSATGCEMGMSRAANISNTAVCSTSRRPAA